MTGPQHCRVPEWVSTPHGRCGPRHLAISFAVFVTVLATLPSPVAAAAARRPLGVAGLAGSEGAEARALAAADFDRDGTPDLVIAYATPAGGAIALHRGNPAALFPAPGSDRTPPPFLEGIHADLPAAADLVAAGDFDDDGALDVVAAELGSPALWWLRGDGTGALAAPRRVALPAGVTALAAGEIGRPDGLVDLAVAIAEGDIAALLLWSSPDGALSVLPERLALPAAARSVAVGRLADSPFGAVAVAAGVELVVVHGRDARRSGRTPALAPLVIERIGADTELAAVAVADFRRASPGGEIALLTLAGDLLLVDREGGDRDAAANVAGDGWRIAERIVAAADGDLLGIARVGAATLVAGGYDEHGQALFVAGEGGLHAAIGSVSAAPRAALVAALALRLGARATPDLVVLERGSTAPLVYSATAPAATLTVNSTADPGDGLCDVAHCTLREAIAAANALPGVDTIAFAIAGAGVPTISPATPLPAIVDPVVLDGTTQAAGRVELSGAGVPAPATNCFDSGDLESGLRLQGGSSTVRGLAIHSFPCLGLRIASNGNVIEGNFIGLGAGGTAAGLGNGNGGIEIASGAGNRIGGTVGTTPGGACTGACNAIGGHSQVGISLQAASAGSQILGNFIGVGADGTTDRGNTNGLALRAAAEVGDGTAAGRNVISGGSSSGLRVETNVVGALVQGNFVGTDSSGSVAIPNNSDGISLAGLSHTIGGAAGSLGGACTGSCNLLSGNHDSGMEMEGSIENTLVQGNFVGTDASGTAAVPNLGTFNNVGGIEVRDDDNTLAANLIAGNVGRGLRVSTNGNNGPVVVLGNRIGTDTTGLAPLGNSGHGVQSGSGTDALELGGTGAGDGNQIAHNGGKGVVLDEFVGAGNPLRGNSIHDNGGLAIDLGDDGPTPNDPADADVGPNQLQNFPLPTAADVVAGSTLVSGTFDSTPSTTFDLDFYANPTCAPGARGEATTYVGSAQVLTDADGAVDFAIAVPAAAAVGQHLSATATAPDGSTSELSPCVEVTTATPADLAIALADAPDPVEPGGALVYTLNVDNLGPTSASGVQVVLVLPQDALFASSIPGAPSCVGAAHLVVCDLGGLLSGANVEIQVTATVQPGAHGELVATAYVSGQQSDPNSANDSATATTQVEPEIFVDGFESSDTAAWSATVP